MWLTLVVITLAFLIVWLGSGAVEGYMDAKRRPAEAMEWCHKHGAFRKKHVLEFAETTVCPRCYYEAFKKVENG